MGLQAIARTTRKSAFDIMAARTAWLRSLPWRLNLQAQCAQYRDIDIDRSRNRSCYKRSLRAAVMRKCGIPVAATANRSANNRSGQSRTDFLSSKRYTGPVASYQRKRTAKAEDKHGSKSRGADHEEQLRLDQAMTTQTRQ
ncbi:hypothetical protein shn_32265 (plasmid) [Shinella sp. HZN7]|nr:hypothetical protein shn_32265 [Shinella sp. HZN7]